MGVPITDPLAQLSLSPGFRFYPTDEELLVQYLCNKVAGRPFSSQIIGEIELYKYDPWVLPSKAMFGEKEWYFFTPRDRKYPNGSRPNRIAGSGYWKATGTDKVITTGERKIGIKKVLVFYIGKAPKGTKTNWIMHEYRLLNSTCKSGSSKLDEWVLCRIYKKNSGGQKPTSTIMSTKGHLTNCSSSSSSSQTDHHGDVMHSVPEIDDRPNVNNQPMGSTSFDWAILAGLSSVPEIGPVQPNQGLFGYADNAIDRYVPSGLSISMMNCGGSVEEEVQFGLRNQPVGNPGNYFQLNQGDLTRNFSNSVEPYELRFPAQPDSGYGFRQ